MGYEISRQIRHLATQFNSKHEFILKLSNKEKSNQNNHNFELSELKTWLENKDVAVKKHALTEALLVNALMKSVAKKLNDVDFEDYQPKKVSIKDKIKWVLVLIAGTFLASSDAVGPVLGLVGFLNISLLVLLGVTILYSVFASIMFYLFELYEISSQMGVSFLDARKIVDIHINEIENITKLINALEQEKLNKKGIRCQTDDDILLLDILSLRLQALNAAKKQLDEVAGAKKIKAIRFVLTAIGAASYGLTGFFSGMYAVNAIALLFMTTVPFVFWPALLAGAIGVLCAVYMFYVMQRPAIESFVRERTGVDVEKLNEFEEQTNDLERRLEDLKIIEPKLALQDVQQEENKRDLIEENEKLRIENESLTQQLKLLKNTKPQYAGLIINEKADKDFSTTQRIEDSKSNGSSPLEHNRVNLIHSLDLSLTRVSQKSIFPKKIEHQNHVPDQIMTQNYFSDEKN